MQFDDVVLQCFLKHQLQLFPETVAESPEEAEHAVRLSGRLGEYQF